jgi:hypothetical protein
LFSDIKSGATLPGEAAVKLLSLSKDNIAASARSVMRIAGADTARAIADFRGSDDLGVKALVSAKDAVVKMDRSIKLTRGAGRTLTKSVALSKKTATKTYEAGKAIYAFGKSVLSNPAALKAIGVSAALIVVIAALVTVISSIVSVVPSLSLKSEDWELTQAYLYITELDAFMEYEIQQESERERFPEIKEFHYYLNGAAVPKGLMLVYTDADLMLAILDSKYEDFTFNGILDRFFGKTIKGEIQEIHAALHNVTHLYWSYEVTRSRTNPSGGTDTWHETIHCMDISLSTKTLESYLESYRDILLTSSQRQTLDAILEVGVYTFRKELSNPFAGKDWSDNVSSRWGWRVHPIDKVLSAHSGLDIAMPWGTPINTVTSGIVEIPPFDSGGYGNYATVTGASGARTLYAHMSVIAATDGQEVSPGELIGYVGSTGGSTGNHLHIEYHKDGRTLCPIIFIDHK